MSNLEDEILGKPVKALVILSGGMDSGTVLAYAVHVWGADKVFALTFDYGQRHAKEMKAAEALAQHFGVKHIVFHCDLGQIGGSALTDTSIPVPDFKADVGDTKHVALTYVPMRNTIFIAIAAAFAEVLSCTYIYTGFNWIDSGGYPDTREEYVKAMNSVLQKGSRDQPTLNAPLIEMTKKQIVEFGQRYNVPWEKTWSCYKGEEKPCGECNACVQRAKGFYEAGVVDPLTGVVPPVAVQKQSGQTTMVP